MELPKDEWSEEIRQIKPGVQKIFYKGNVSLLLDQSPKLAIVGSRRMTEYGKRVIEKWMPTLVAKGITIVSGFMYGVDQTAHDACIENGGKTIAVLGYGIDFEVGGLDRDLYQKLIDRDSLIMSEYEGVLEGGKWTFPQRNRIVAGISDAVLVIEGALRSGSMITARLGREMGKVVLALPGQVTSRVAEGTNGLIRDGKAEMVTNANDVLRAMNLSEGQLSLKMGKVYSDPVLSLLADGERNIDELSRILRMVVPETLALVTKLVLCGEVVEFNGKLRLR